MFDSQVWQSWIVAVKHSGIATLALAFGALGCAAFAFWAARRETTLGDAASALRWYLSAATWFTATLGFAWRLDLLVAGMLRYAFQGLGWYEDRRAIQIVALLFFVGALVWLADRMLPAAGSKPPIQDSEGWFLLATIGVLALLLLRMGSLHHVDELLAERFLVASLGRWIEAALVAIALCCAAYRLPRH